MLISFLKKEDEDGNPQSKFMGKGDIIFLLVVAGLIGGFWYYNKSIKEQTLNHYSKCEVLFFTDKLSEAKECYEEEALTLNYRLDSLDSIGSNRVEKIEAIMDGDDMFLIDSLYEAKLCYGTALSLGIDPVSESRMRMVDSMLEITTPTQP